jgi:hypothetical protein
VPRRQGHDDTVINCVTFPLGAPVTDTLLSVFSNVPQKRPPLITAIADCVGFFGFLSGPQDQRRPGEN